MLKLHRLSRTTASLPTQVEAYKHVNVHILYLKVPINASFILKLHRIHRIHKLRRTTVSLPTQVEAYKHVNVRILNPRYRADKSNHITGHRTMS